MLVRPRHPFKDAHFFALGSSWRLSGPKSDQRGPFEERPTSRKPWPDTHAARGARYSTQLTNRHTVAAKVAMVVIQPRTLVKRLFTRSPITSGSLVMSIIRRSRGGTEKPWTTPDQTSAFIGFRPIRFSNTATAVTIPIVK